MPTTMRYTAQEKYDADWLEITPIGDVEVVGGVAEVEDEELVNYLWRSGYEIVSGDVPADLLDAFDGEFPYVSRWYDTDPDRPVDAPAEDAPEGEDDAEDEEGDDAAQPDAELAPVPAKRKRKQ